MMLTHPRLGRGARGQGLAEYVIVLALIAIAAIGVVTLFGDSVRNALGLSAPPPAPTVEVEVQRRGQRPAVQPDAN